MPRVYNDYNDAGRKVFNYSTIPPLQVGRLIEDQIPVMTLQDKVRELG